MKKILTWLDKAGSLSEDLLLVALLLGMIVLATGQIVARNLFGTAYILGDETLRLLVLWLTLAGAIAAARADRHIAISLLDRFLEGRYLALSRVLTGLFTASVCALIGWYSLQFVQMSREFEDVLLGDKPAWILQLILPVGFGLMSYRYLVLSLRQAWIVIKGPQD